MVRAIIGIPFEILFRVRCGIQWLTNKAKGL
jgi:hypothetical protein